jgi:MazG family protein
MRDRILGRVKNDELKKLSDLIDVLRGENGCPWDQAQKPADILSDLVEEVHELQWAYAEGKREAVREELGDVVFVLVFALKLLEEQFPGISLEDVTSAVHAKIHFRHPHVFGNDTAKTKEEGLAHWNRMKAAEGKGRGENIFADIPGMLPPIRRAEKIQRRAAATGFDWSDTAGILTKIREEIEELESALAEGPYGEGGQRERVEAELGDAFFSLINLSRFLNVDGEKALTGANAKFVARFLEMERLAKGDGRNLAAMTLDEMDRYWERAKKSAP